MKKYGKILILILFIVLSVNSFGQVTLTSSNLPIISVNTLGGVISDNVRIVCDMGIIFNGLGERNYITDPYNDYNGKISIEIRGSSSQSFEKKSYGLETQTDSGENNNAALLGMPPENDWILYGPYSDKSLMRNYLSYYLARRTGRYAPRTRFCELLINDEYKGLYILTEKIKRDTNRVNIAKLKETDLSGDELTGGYILKIDKFEGTVGEPFTSVYPPFPGSDKTVYIQNHDPESQELQEIQKFYIQNYMYMFETDLYNADPNDLSIIWNKYADMGSFIDFLIINEVSKNIDGYRLSTFFYKDKFSHGGGKLKMGPVWDFNLSFGNGNYYEGWMTSGWQYEFKYTGEGDYYQMPFWWDKILQNDDFKNALKTRWSDLRQSFLHTDSLLNFVDETALYLNEAQERNFQKWDILGSYVWPNWYIPDTYEEEIQFMKNWIIDRLDWIDNNLPGTYISEVESTPESTHFMYPNPTKDFVMIRELNKADIFVSDLSGKLVFYTTDHTGVLKIDTNGFPPGMYIVSIRENSKTEKQKLIVNR